MSVGGRLELLWFLLFISFKMLFAVGQGRGNDRRNSSFKGLIYISLSDTSVVAAKSNLFVKVSLFPWVYLLICSLQTSRHVSVTTAPATLHHT